MPHEGNVRFAVRAADPHEPSLVELGARLQQRRGGDAVDRNADHRAVLGPLSIKLVGHHNAAGRRLVLHQNVRIAWNMVDEVTRDDAREQIVAATHGRAHDHAQLLAPVERGDVALRARLRCRADKHRDEQRGSNEFHSHTLSRYPAGVTCTGTSAVLTANNRPRWRGGVRQPMRRNASQITA